MRERIICGSQAPIVLGDSFSLMFGVFTAFLKADMGVHGDGKKLSAMSRL